MFSMYQANSWTDLKADTGNTLHISKLENKTKHGKKADSFVLHVYPRDVKSALCLVVNLFLEQIKVADEVSDILDSLMKIIKTSDINDTLHANSFGKVSLFLLQIK